MSDNKWENKGCPKKTRNSNEKMMPRDISIIIWSLMLKWSDSPINSHFCILKIFYFIWNSVDFEFIYSKYKNETPSFVRNY